MLEKNQHIIHRQILNLELGSGLSDADIREKYQGELAEKMSEVMDSIFEQMAPGEELLTIDKIEIDLGECSEEEFLSIFRSRFSEQIRKASEIKPAKGSRSEGLTKKLSYGQREFECFVFFLEQGYFPWWADKIDLKEFERSLGDQLEKADRKTLAWLAERLKIAYVPKRLSRQFSLRFNIFLLERIYPEISRELQSFIIQLPKLFIDIPGIKLSVTGQALENYVLESTWEKALEAGLNEKADNIREKVIADILVKNNLPAKAVTGLLDSRIDLNSDVIEKLIIEKGKKQQGKTKEQKEDKKTKEHEAEGLFIENAGLVILWPFLQELYAKLDLVHGKAFKSEKHQERAVLLTQYLVTEETGIDEPQLPLNKIMNGWPLKKPVDGKLELTGKEKEILRNLLKKLIENWPALKNTSTAALQETYLQRNGLLEQENDSWNLKVERKTVDVLRDTLPWPINIISLPWMDTIIYVKW